jgi:exodeoxyribonuclease VII large subunit
VALPRFETTYSVAELGREIKALLGAAFESVWVAGEVQRAKLSSAGHLYFELVEPAEKGGLAGRLDAVVWKGELGRVRRALSATGQELADGLLLRCRVTVDFYPPGGRLQLQVREVDPVFGLGELERRRRETIAALEASGLATRNRALPFPPLPLAIGLVTSAGSAAYHDFLATLAESGYAFRVAFAHAAVQGREAEREVPAALARLGELPLDCIALVRGGGARTDLAAFDSQAIAEAVACAPLPVVTGLGHEIDLSVADLVAHTAVKTPTKAAELLVERLRGAEAALEQLRDRLARGATAPFVHARTVLDRAGRTVTAIRPRLERDAARLTTVREGLTRAVPGRLAAARSTLTTTGGRLERAAARRLERAAQAPRLLAHRLADRAAARLALVAARLEGHQRLLAEIGPERVLARGFSITRFADGRLLRDAAEAAAGSRLVTRLARGSVTSSVEER